MSTSILLPLCLSVLAASVGVGDKVLTVTAAPVMSGPEKLAEVPQGVELTAIDVRDHYVRVTVTQGQDEISGWIYEEYLVREPTIAIGRLLLHYKHDYREIDRLKRADEKFGTADVDKDGLLTQAEFVNGTRKPTLDELNEDFRRVIAKKKPALFTKLDLCDLVLQFEGWKTDWIRELNNPNWKANPKPLDKFNQPGPMTEFVAELMRTGDLRRSARARQLLDGDNSESRARRATALYKWADADGNGKLTRQEYHQCLNLDTDSQEETEPTDEREPEGEKGTGVFFRDHPLPLPRARRTTTTH